MNKKLIHIISNYASIKEDSKVTKLKDIAKRYNIDYNTFTQIKRVLDTVEYCIKEDISSLVVIHNTNTDTLNTHDNTNTNTNTGTDTKQNTDTDTDTDTPNTQNTTTKKA